MLTQKKTLELFNYNPETGIVIRRLSRGNRSAGSIVGTQGSGERGYVYLSVEIDCKSYILARVIWLMQTGKWPIRIDHENHNTFDNRWKNLRNVCHQANCQNRSLFSNNTSGQCGVHWHHGCRKWRAGIWICGKSEDLGLYDNFVNAVKARKDAEKKYRFHENHGKRGALKDLEKQYATQD